MPSPRSMANDPGWYLFSCARPTSVASRAFCRWDVTRPGDPQGDLAGIRRRRRWWSHKRWPQLEQLDQLDKLFYGYSPNQYQMRRRSPKFIQVCYPRYNWSSISILHLGIQESPRDWNMCWSENMLPPNLMLTVIRHIGLKLARNLDGPWDQRFLVNDL